MMSRSLRARGLKLRPGRLFCLSISVALFTGAWIEMQLRKKVLNNTVVALFTGAWIEIKKDSS